MYVMKRKKKSRGAEREREKERTHIVTEERVYDVYPTLRLE